MKFLYKKNYNAKISSKVSPFPMKRREELIQEVIFNEKSITYAAKKLRIKYSTARIIIIKYRETGSIFNKNMHKKEPRLTSEEVQSFS